MALAVLPRVTAYLDRLPGGIDAFPEAEVKYSVVATWLEGHDAGVLVDGLPTAVHPLLQREFPVTRWISEVHATTIYLGLRERLFSSDDAFVADALRRNHTLLNKPMYRILMRLLSRSRVAKGASVAYFPNAPRHGTRRRLAGGPGGQHQAPAPLGAAAFWAVLCDRHACSVGGQRLRECLL